MSSSHLLDPFIVSLLSEKDHSYLDIACGFGKWGYLLWISHKPPSVVVGGDLDIDAIGFTNRNGAYGSIVRFDARWLPLRDNSLDIVIASEVVEHVCKEDGLKILDEAERVSRIKTIASTPLLGGLYWFSKDYHVSRWVPSDFQKRGYTVRGVGFSLFGRWSTMKLAYALGPLSYYFPWFSHILLAWKTKKA